MDALLLVDIQNDFCPGGELAVPSGNEVIAVANHLMPHFRLVVATQDWHPPDHLSFAANHSGAKPGDVVSLGESEQILWPVHCVQETTGAALVAELCTNRIDLVVPKGMRRERDSYSGFFDNDHETSTGLDEELRRRGVTRLYVLGLATDYCVKFTCLDAARLGFETVLVIDGCRGVEITPGDVNAAVHAMQSANVRIANSDEVVAERKRAQSEI